MISEIIKKTLFTSRSSCQGLLVTQDTTVRLSPLPNRNMFVIHINLLKSKSVTKSSRDMIDETLFLSMLYHCHEYRLWWFRGYFFPSYPIPSSCLTLSVINIFLRSLLPRTYTTTPLFVLYQSDLCIKFLSLVTLSSIFCSKVSVCYYYVTFIGMSILLYFFVISSSLLNYQSM